MNIGEKVPPSKTKSPLRMKHDPGQGQQISTISTKITDSVWQFPISASTQFLPWRPNQQCKSATETGEGFRDFKQI